MEEYPESQEAIRVSKFNSSLAILYRIDILWKDAHRHSRMGLLIRWNWDLDRVWTELAADAKENDLEAFQKFNKKISEINKIKEREKLYTTLLNKEIFLRKLQNKQGKGMSYEENIDDYMD